MLFSLLIITIVTSSAQTAFSQIPEGTILARLTFSGGNGLAVGFDGQLLYFTASGSGGDPTNRLKRTTTNGMLLNDLPLDCYIETISYDYTRGKFWGANGETGTIYTIDPNSGTCSLEFTFNVSTTCGAACNIPIDGLGYDYTDESIWFSYDQQNRIFHYDLSGNQLGSITISGTNTFTPECPSNQNSGIATGDSNVLYLSHLTCDYVFKFDKNGNKIGSFFVGLSKEDMECDNVTFSDMNTDAIWVANPLNNAVMELVAFAVEQGTCTNNLPPTYYPVKFHCGEVPDSVIAQSRSSGLEESPVKPGNYNTAIDIYSNQNSTAIWKVSLAYPAQTKSELTPVKIVESGTMEIDCGQIRQKLPPIEVVTGYPKFIKGFVIIYANDLDVTATYTYREQPDIWWRWLGLGMGASIDVETIAPKPLFGSQTITLPPQCLAPSISISDVTVTEGNSGTTTMSFVISLSQPSSCGITVTYSTVPGSASTPSDYYTTTQTATIQAGNTSTTINIPIVGDLTPEPPEIFSVQISSPINGMIGDDTGFGTILDNDSTTSTFIINGTKFLDELPYHQRDNLIPEVGLLNWNITLFDFNTGQKVASMLTQDDPNPAKKGWFSFTVPAGHYRLCEKDDVVNHWETLPYPGYTTNLVTCQSPPEHPYGYDIFVTTSNIINMKFGNNNTHN